MQRALAKRDGDWLGSKWVDLESCYFIVVNFGTGHHGLRGKPKRNQQTVLAETNRDAELTRLLKQLAGPCTDFSPGICSGHLKSESWKLLKI